MNTAVTKQERTPELIATEIRIIKERTAQTLAQAAFEIGRRLCEAKELVPAGNWLEYLENQLDYKSSTAENLMRIYREFGDEQVDLLTGKSPAEVFGKLNQSQMVAMFSLAPAERIELVEEHPEIAEKSAREVQQLVKEKKAAEQERDRERSQREKAEKLAARKADETERQKQHISDLEKELERTRSELTAEMEKHPDSDVAAEKDNRIAELEKQIADMKSAPVEATYTEPAEELKAQIRAEVQQEFQQKLENVKNSNAQRIQFDFAEIQAKYIDARKHLEAFCESDAAKAKLLAAAMAQTFHNMGAEIEKFK